MSENKIKAPKALLFYNPNAGSGMFKSNLDHIIGRFQKKGVFVFAVRAQNDVDINQIIANLDDSFIKIIAAGGDGTINIVVNAMMKCDCHIPLAVFPAGTANDFAHYFEIPTDIDGMLDIALEDHYVSADVGNCNGRYFVNVAAIGSVIDVSQKTDANMKNALGILSYYLKGLTELSALKPVEIEIESPVLNLKENIFFMVVLNGNSAGGFRKLGIESAINDGLLDVIIFKEMKITDLPKVALSVLAGKHNENENVIYFQTPKLKISSKEYISTDVDGELGEPMPLDIQIVPSRLLINTRRIRSFDVERTDRHEELNAFYEANGLEITAEEPVTTDTLASWEIIENEKTIAACTLAYRENEYIIDGIAVDPDYRGHGLGKSLLNSAEAEVRRLGGKSLYLVARSPEFFRANGFVTVERKDAPEFFECFSCEQYGHGCEPEVMLHML